jgi:poly(hydroxyalkanoate) granule-associated protein
MVKKLKQMADKQAAGSGMLDNQLAQAVRDSAQQIWLAGMGAFAKAQAEGGKVFEALVKEGTHLQRKTQAAAEERIAGVAGKMSAVADGVTSKAGQQWDKLEAIFEQRVDKALAKLRVPSAKDLQVLNERIDALNAQLAALGGKPAKAAPVRAARKAAKSAPAKAAPVKAAAKRRSTRAKGGAAEAGAA